MAKPTRGAQRAALKLSAVAKKAVDIGERIDKFRKSPGKIMSGLAQATVGGGLSTLPATSLSPKYESKLFKAGEKGLKLMGEGIRDSGIPDVVRGVKKVLKK